jgi:hypothetical protein
MKTKITFLALLVSFFSLTVSAELVTWSGGGSRRLDNSFELDATASGIG